MENHHAIKNNKTIYFYGPFSSGDFMVYQWLMVNAGWLPSGYD